MLLMAALLLAGCTGKDLTTPQLYKRHCARCHGAAGEGHPRGLKRYPHLDFLVSPMVRRGERATVRQRIVEGHGPMPGYARRLTPQEIERLVDFTFQLSRSRQENP
jgi:mono/diheme cytochrome c family protein